MKQVLINVLKFVLFLSVGLGILYYLYTDFSQKYLVDCMAQGKTEAECNFGDKLVNDLKSAKPFWIFMVFFTFTISNISRAIRWKMLLKPLGRNARLVNTFFCTMIGYFTNLFLPRAGEVIKAGTLSRYENVAVEKVMGTVVLDRLLDVISILIVTFLAIVLEYDKIWGYFSEPVMNFFGEKGMSILMVLGVVLVAVLVVAYLFRAAFAGSKLYKKIVELLLGFKEGILSVAKLDNVPLFLVHSVNIWFMYFLMVYFSFFAFAPTSHLTPIVALLTFVFGAWGIVIPSPGGMGSYHVLTVLVLGMYGVSKFDAASYSNIAFCTINIGTNIIFGIIGFTIIAYLNRIYHPQEIEHAG